MATKPALLLSLFLLSTTLTLTYPKLVLELEECKYICSQREQLTKQQREECFKKCELQTQGQGQGQQPSGVNRQQEQQQDQNPYFFPQQSMKSQLQSQEGSIRILQRFFKKSNLLEGIDYFRLGFYEGNPNTFNIPNYWDAHAVCFVIQGKGSITMLEENNKKTYNLERGDIIRVRSGVTVYVLNRDNSQKFQMVTLILPVNIPGKFKTFFPAGGKDPESIFNAFSDNILEAAFNTPRAKLQRLFQGQTKGAIVKASREQIQALSRPSMERSPWLLPPFQHEEKGTINLFNKRPQQSNQYGKLFQVDQNDYPQLKELDVAIGFLNITRGAMFGPYYNSRSTHIAVVVDGRGYFEMACPHMSSSSRKQSEQGQQEQEGEQGQQEQEGEQGQQEQEGEQGQQEQEGEQGQQEQEGRQGQQEQEEQQGGQQWGGEQGSSTKYMKVTARLSRGDVFVVPAGHPLVAVASGDQNFQVMCFEINAENNKKYPLAGKNNILRQLEKEAKELSFDMPARQVDEILEKQDQSWFFLGPHQQQQHGHTYV